MTDPFALHPMLTTQLRNAEMKTTQIEAVVRHLAVLMEEAHGESFRFQIDHQVGLVAVVRRIRNAS